MKIGNLLSQILYVQTEEIHHKNIFLNQKKQTNKQNQTMSPISLPITHTTFLRNLNVEKILQDKIDRRRANANTRFPVKLYKMLSEAENGGYEHIVSWNDDGSSFQIHDKKRFVEKIMPKYLTQSQFRSFQKQLNLYGFERRVVLSSKPTTGSYRHPDFRRDNEELCKTITRPSTAREAKLLKQARSLKQAQEEEEVVVEETTTKEKYYRDDASAVNGSSLPVVATAPASVVSVPPSPCLFGSLSIPTTQQQQMILHQQALNFITRNDHFHASYSNKRIQKEKRSQLL